MTKREIANKVALKVGISQKEALNMLNLLVDEIKKGLLNKEKLEVRGFGTFKRIRAEAKIARDIKKNKQIALPDCFRVKFMPSKRLKEMVNSKQR